jgi:hypothetical protein
LVLKLPKMGLEVMPPILEIVGLEPDDLPVHIE